MGERCGSLFPQQQFVLQSPNLNYPGTGQRSGPQDAVPSVMKPAADMVSPKGTLLGSVYPELPFSKVSQLNEPHGWFYCLPHLGPAFVPSVNPILWEKSVAPYDNIKEAVTPKAPVGCPQKRFLVFDQSGDQTTLIFSSGIGKHVRCFTSWNPKTTGACNLNKDITSKGNYDAHLQPLNSTEVGKNIETDLLSEMHEDTEELNALLYSDDDSDYPEEEDEVTSTGHSPSTMTSHDKEGCFDHIAGHNAEEIASCDGSSKKRKLLDMHRSDIPSLVDTANSLKPLRGLEYEDDAESKCADDMNPAPELGYEPCNKKMRKEKIRETVNILQNIIPGLKGKDPVAILDEAVQYLKYLKLKAEALGLVLVMYDESSVSKICTRSLIRMVRMDYCEEDANQIQKGLTETDRFDEEASNGFLFVVCESRGESYIVKSRGFEKVVPTTGHGGVSGCVNHISCPCGGRDPL